MYIVYELIDPKTGKVKELDRYNSFYAANYFARVFGAGGDCVQKDVDTWEYTDEKFSIVNNSHELDQLT